MFEQNFFNSEEESEFLPIVPLIDENEDDFDSSKLVKSLPAIILKNTLLFPQTVMPITVSRDKSLRALKESEKEKNYILVFTQKDPQKEDLTTEDLYPVGILAHIVRQIKMPDGSTTIILRGKERVKMISTEIEDPYFRFEYAVLKDIWPEKDAEFNAMIDSAKELAKQIIQISPNLPSEASNIINNINNQKFLLHFIAINLSNKVEDKYKLLETDDINQRVIGLLKLLQTEKEFAELKNKIDNKTRADIDQQQKEYFLQQQMKSIREELGGESNDKEIQDLKSRAEQKKLTQEAKELFEKSIQKLERMHPTTPDYSVVYNHLDVLLDLPWNEFTEDVYDLKKAQKVLDKEHYGMDKIKDRILEYLAVLKLKGDLKSPILCFVGPPGIGKTSLGKSIASSINRKYTRLSFGGLHDESEIRGHRKTYIGAMPGRIIQALRKVKSSNPVFVLDEIDKIGSDFRGDPSSALLEVLDPEQNNSFYDNYLECEYDLSKVLFIATANSINEIQPALRDRLEIIHLNGYSVEEKVEIAKKHLLPKQKEAHGLNKYKFEVAVDSLESIVQNYTMESGVRELDRQLASLMRVIAKDVAINDVITKKPDINNLKDFLGNEKYSNDKYQTENPAGVAVGLAWTYVGGDILFLEALLNKGKGALQLTGSLGQVMKESASTAFTYLKSMADKLKIKSEDFENLDLHIHVPEGATPKDGPSAGVTMLTAMASIYTGRKVKPFLAMTGEITLRGQVLPVGGIKEKILAAKRAGLKEILLCTENKKDILEINPKYIKGLKFHYVSKMEEVLKIALTK